MFSVKLCSLPASGRLLISSEFRLYLKGVPSEEKGVQNISHQLLLLRLSLFCGRRSSPSDDIRSRLPASLARTWSRSRLLQACFRTGSKPGTAHNVSQWTRFNALSSNRQPRDQVLMCCTFLHTEYEGRKSKYIKDPGEHYLHMLGVILVSWKLITRNLALCGFQL